MTISCNCPQKCEIHPKPQNAPKPLLEMKQQAPSGPPLMSLDDQFMLKKLESTWLSARLNVREAQSQLEMFGSALYDKYGLSQHEWALDFTGPGFVPKLKQG